jgi:hypothetical protein
LCFIFTNFKKSPFFKLETSNSKLTASNFYHFKFSQYQSIASLIPSANLYFGS